MKVRFEISRFDSTNDAAPYTQSYELEMEPTQRVLDALTYIKRNLDATLAFRKSCAHGVCGSDAMLINGREALACKTLIQDVAQSDGATVTLAPLRHLEVQRDLMVSQRPFFSKYTQVKPYFIADERQPLPEKGGERIQSKKQRAAIDDPTKCILCAACYSACPVLNEDPLFLGPAALVQAARFVFDSRDQGLGARREILDRPHSVWGCENHFECTRVCPREIKVTKLINFTKRKIQES